MTHDEIVNLLKETFNEVSPNGTFVPGQRPDASLISNTAAWPMSVLFPMRSVRDYKKGNQKWSVAMSFLTKDDTNNSLDERTALISTMSSLINQYMEQLIGKYESPVSGYYGKASITSEVLATEEHKILNGYASGYSVQFTLTTKIPC